MVDEPDSLILRYLRRIDERQERLAEDMADVKLRLTSLESSVSRVQGELASIHADFAGQSKRIDRIEQRLDRIEQRLDLLPV
jgi:chromosome segregation ATPase